MKTDRLVSIIMMLLDKERVSAQELADRFEVSPRTIYRDIETINMAGIPVRSTPGVGGGFEIMQEYKLDKNVFSAADLSAILMGLSSLSGMVRGNELVNALAKVRRFIPADRAKEIELRANQIYIDLSPWMGNRNIQPYLELVKTALQESRMLSFEYADRFGNKTVRTVEPYQIVLKGSHWYFQGYCRKREDFRLFRLSRISNLQMSRETFSPRDYQKPVLDFGDILKTMQTTIKLRVQKSAMDRLLDFCTCEHAVPDGEEHYIVNFPFIENEYYYDILISFGDQCECLEPLHVRAEMKRRIQNMAALYDG
ncbi:MULTISPECIES: YafY family protein [Enterocloster]|uniref:Predicted DNA-binding transcriptional regulator YafY, contains an HTH and WYL domains n=1 Tax=Enterocloster lavalensis TaxID=460384 RepID=A0A1I0K5Z1_9FIRM|nr:MULTISPECIES: YafY family protein [Enterocloster]MDR3756941.1 YafY family protein [Enterocloster sp.]PST31045.1 YafY family transcriptional regulator [Enterocloster lavalensis]SEU18539.1 Predicted DNA-binding transcriptional regulator YafY, contains an HTH and WYL domains [Enterocloster lavalensis]